MYFTQKSFVPLARRAEKALISNSVLESEANFASDCDERLRIYFSSKESLESKHVLSYVRNSDKTPKAGRLYPTRIVNFTTLNFCAQHSALPQQRKSSI